MPWRPVGRIAFGVCIYPFQPSSPADLPLEIGDELYIIEQGGKDGSWYRGYLVAPPSLLAGLTTVKGQTLEARVFSGIFPKCCVEIREILGEERGRSRQGDLAGRTSGKGTGPHASVQTNGILTPDGSASSTPAKHKSLKDALGSAPAIPVSKADALRLSRHKSALTLRSEATSQPQLPLSPMSIGPRDPNAPKPPAPVPMLKIGDETPTSAQEPLVDEIASCLREWHSTKLHELLLARKYGTLDRMSNLVQRLDTSRRQLLHKVLTNQELGELRERTVWDLVAGNKMLSGEIIVRNPAQRGRILMGEDSAIEITKLQSIMSLLPSKPTSPPDEHGVHHLLVEIPHALGELMSPKTIAVHLCSKKPGEPLQPVSEVHAINLSAQTGAAPEGNMKTLFVELGSADFGEGSGAGSQLFVVFKVIVNEQLRSPVAQTAAAPATPRQSESHSGAPFNLSQMGSMKGGRRSLMWATVNRRKTDSELTKNAPVEERPASTSTDRALPADNRPKTGEQRPPTREQKTVKRTVAAGIVRVDQILKQNTEIEQEVTLWTPATYAYMDEQAEHDAVPDALVKEILSSATGEYRKYTFAKPVKAFAKVFTDDDAEALIKRTPTLLQNISETRRIGFAGAPSKARSDIYMTLTEAFLPKHAFLAHPKSSTTPLGTQQGLANLQLTLEVRKSNGQRIENCIYPSCNSQGHTAWRTTAAERGEAWNLTIRLAIAPEDVPGSHVVMSIADLPGFPFALCWMPLWNDGAFIQDGEHALTLYQYDEYTSSIISGRGAYLALPWGTSRRDQMSHPHSSVAMLHLRTFLCSTKYSQDPDLLGLLDWKKQTSSELPGLLRRFVFVPEIEIVKLLDEVLDALFEILVDCAGSAEYENLVFEALVYVLGITYDRRFKLAPLVDQYAIEKFKYPRIGSSLIRSFIRLLSDPTGSDSRKLRATFKVGAHIFKFISVARQQQEKEEIGVSAARKREAFLRETRDIFLALESLMKNPNPVLIGTKTMVVQHIHNWFPELIGFMAPEEILELTVSFVDSCSAAQGKLILFKLILIIHLTQLDAFKLPKTKRQLLTHTVRWLAPYWGRTPQVNEQWKDQVRLCCSIVAAQINEIGEEGSEYIPKLVDSYRAIQMVPRVPKKSLSLLFPTQYPFPSRPIGTETSSFDEALVEIAAVLAAITTLPITIHLELPKPELAEFLFSALQVYISILSGDEAYPASSWLSVHIFHHRSTLRSLEKLASILIDSFLPHPDEADQFNTELWRAFFDALLKLVGSEALALETFPEQKRRAVWKIAGDVRELGADLLRTAWEAIGWETSPDDKALYGLEKLGGYQVQYVPGLVGPIVELCLSVHEGLRSVAIGVLQSMIVSEWTLSQDLGLIQAEIVECLDRMFKDRTIMGESTIYKMFLGEMVEMFLPLSERNDQSGLLAAVKVLVNTIDELLDLLVAVHSTEASGEAFHIMDTLRLMEFLKDMQKEDIFIRYVHQLANLQANARNHTEAGLALRLHADLYEWDPVTVVENLRDPYFPSQTAFERKEQLYFEMIKHYEESQSWDNALGSYMELADQYEHNIFDFAKLARAQRAMATIYERISRGLRDNPRYFRVVYKGFGFPASIREKQFIFEGQPSDRLSSFVDRLQQQHPAAEVRTSGSSDEDVEGQYIYVFPVSPQKDLLHPIYQRMKVTQSVRDYYLLSRPSTFTSTSKRKPSDGGIHEQSVEKTLYTTAEPFPTILRRSEINSTSTITLTALQSAIERTTRKTAELITLEKKVLDGEDAAFTALTEALMLSVDPASASSVAHYRTFLTQTEDSHRAASDAGEDDDALSASTKPDHPLDPLENALRIALIDYAVIVKRCLSHYSRPAHQATKNDLQQRKSLPSSPSSISTSSSWLTVSDDTFSPFQPFEDVDHDPPGPDGARSSLLQDVLKAHTVQASRIPLRRSSLALRPQRPQPRLGTCPSARPLAGHPPA